MTIYQVVMAMIHIYSDAAMEQIHYTIIAARIVLSS